MNNFKELYNDKFLPAYSDLVGYIANKPEAIIEQFERVFTHLMVYHTNSDESIRNENLKKAHDHLIRITLDCRKLLWVELDEIVKTIIESPEKRKLSLNINESELFTMYNKYISTAQNARQMEISSIGIDPLKCIEEYEKTIKIGFKIIESQDPSKLHYVNELVDKITIIEWIKVNIIPIFVGGVIGGIIAGLITQFILNILN